MDAPSVDHQVAQALAQGDVRRAAQLLVLHHADAVYATCRALVRDGTLAEDLSQEAFAKAIAALPSFRGEAQSRTWLLSIARNLCLDHLRRQRGPIDERAELDLEVQPSETPPPFELLVRRGDVERGLQVLGETERAIVVLHHAHGVGYPELASSFGIAEGALRMRMSRALLKMRAVLEVPPAPARVVPASVAAPAAAPAREEAASKGGGFVERLRRGLPGAPPAPPAPARPAMPAPRRPEAALGAPAAIAIWPAPAALRDRLLALAG